MLPVFLDGVLAKACRVCLAGSRVNKSKDDFIRDGNGLKSKSFAGTIDLHMYFWGLDSSLISRSCLHWKLGMVAIFYAIVHCLMRGRLVNVRRRSKLQIFLHDWFPLLVFPHAKCCFSYLLQRGHDQASMCRLLLCSCQAMPIRPSLLLAMLPESCLSLCCVLISVWK